MIKNRLFFLLLLITAGVTAKAQEVQDTTKKKRVKMDDVLIKADGYDYEDDSVNHRTLYKKDYRIVNDSTKVHISRPGEEKNGIIITGMFSELANRISGRKKKAENNINELQASKERHYVELRYTPTLVNKLTNLTGDTLAYFMNAYPMSYAFASTVKDLEIKMWIRTNYKDWRANGSKMPKNAPIRKSEEQ